MNLWHRIRRGHWPRWHACSYDGVEVGYGCWDCPHPFHVTIAGLDPELPPPDPCLIGTEYGPTCGHDHR